jgi:Flp pilus assembly secretin CpaC
LQARFFRSLFQEIGHVGLSAEASVVGVNVRGSTAGPEDADKIRLLLRSVLSRFNETIVTDKSSGHLIETQLTFFRINISRLNALGISTVSKEQPAGNEFAKGIIPNFISQFRTGPSIRLQFPDVVVNALTQHGVLKQVARPSLVVASGGKGEIQSGGELLFQTTGQSQKFFSQNYGLTVTLQPNITGTGRISQKIDIKLSNPQSLANPNAISAMQQSVMSTELSSLPDEQILLTKIDLQMSGKAVSKVPIFGHLPIIGELFKNRDLRSENTELWIAMKNSLAVSHVPETQQVEKKTDPATPEAHWLD